jgi:hypothetical protein
MADKSKVRPLPPSIFRRMRVALEGDRQPLVRPSPEELQRQLDALHQELDAHGSPIPKGLTEAEKQAALDPGLGPPLERDDMDPKPGYKTSEFWLTNLMVLVVIPLLGWLSNQATSPLVDILKDLAGGNPVLAAVVLALKPAIFAVLGWAAAELAAKYAASRASVKVAHLQAHALRRAA